MPEDREHTRIVRLGQDGKEPMSVREILLRVYGILQEKGYNPVTQIAGFLASGDPVYITAHKNARQLVRRLDTFDVLEELVRFYLEHNPPLYDDAGADAVSPDSTDQGEKAHRRRGFRHSPDD